MTGGLAVIRFYVLICFGTIIPMKDTILLYNPRPSESGKHKGVPLSLLAVAAPLASSHYRIKIIDANVDENCIDLVLKEVDRALCIGITCMTGPQIAGVLEMAEAVKQAKPDLPVVLGGWHPTTLPEETLENEWIDIIVVGQGEFCFKEVVDQLVGEKDFSGIQGIGYKENGNLILNGRRPIENINDTPPMPYHLIENIERYIFSDWYAKRVLPYISSFGCPHRCGFCAEHNMSHTRWIGLSADRVVREMSALSEQYNLDGFAMYDSNFFVNEKRTSEICRSLPHHIKLGNANGSARILLKYSESSWKVMQGGKIAEILIGAESGDDEVLAFISKGAEANDVVKLKQVASQYDVKLWASLMLGVPFDLEHPDQAATREFNACTRFVKELYDINRNDRFALFLYTPYPGTPLYDFSLKNGVKTPERFADWSGFNLNTVHIPWLTKKHKESADYLGNYVFMHSKPPEGRGEEYSEAHWLKKIYLNCCHVMVSFRIQACFHRFRFEYHLINLLKSIKRFALG